MLDDENNKDFGKSNTRKNRFASQNVGLGKLPPQAIDLEAAVLGAVMLEKDAILTVSGMLMPEFFYEPRNQKIFEAIQALFFKSEPVDILTVTAKLREQADLEMVGGAYYITELTNRVASAANVEYHARIIAQKYIQREVIRISTEAINLAYEDTTDVFDLADHVQTGLFNLLSPHYGRGSRDMNDLTMDALKVLETAAVEGLTGVGSGFEGIDKITAGWQPSDLIIIAARPAMGKTALTVQIARNAAIMYKKPVAVFSLEMSSLQLTNRLISSESGVYLDLILKRKLDDWHWQAIHSSIGPLLDAPIHIDDTPALFLNALRAKAIRLKQLHDIQMIVVDYLQLMHALIDKGGNREREISAISQGLKALAKELNIPVIALSQLSRAVENRPGGAKRPMLSDLRESGSIEQDADMVAFLYRPEYYGITEDEQGRSTVGLTEFIIAKNRNGITDTVPLKFNGAKMKFSDWTDEWSSDVFMGPPPPEGGSGTARELLGKNNFIIRPSRMDDIEDEPPF